MINSSFPPITGVVKHLMIINVLVFFGSYAVLDEAIRSYNPVDAGFSYLGRLSLAAFMPGSHHFQPYQIATYMFMHSDFKHLLFNMLSLFIFGPRVEELWGEKRFLFYYLSCGIGAYLLFMGVQWWEMAEMGFNPQDSNTPMLGASGAIFGVMIAFGYLYANMPMNLLFIPFEIKAKYLVAFLFIMEFVYGIKRTSTGVAHFAHLGGAITGLIIVLLWHNQGKFKRGW